MQQQQTGIPLCFVEKMFYETGSVINVAFISGHHLESYVLQQAANACMEKHPKLKMTPQQDPQTGLLTWQPASMPEVQVVTHEIDSDGDEWKEFLVTLMNKDFTYINETEFRVELIQTPTRSILLAGYPHVLGDGVSGMILVNDILTFYSKYENNEDVTVEPLTVLTDAESLSFPDGIDRESSRKIQKLLEEFKNDRLVWKPIVPYKKSETQLRNIPYFYDQTPEDFKVLYKKCHEHHVQIGSVLIACLYFSIAKLIGKRDIDFSVDIDVDLRNRLSSALGIKDIGLLIGMIQLDQEIHHDTSFWELAVIISKKLKRSLDEGNHFLYHPANRLFDWENPEYLKNVESNKGLTNNLNFSNIGRFPFPSTYETGNGLLQIDKMYCVGNKWVPMFGSFIILVTSVNSICFSLVVDENEENQKTGLTFFRHYTSLIEKCSRFNEEYVLNDFINEE